MYLAYRTDHIRLIHFLLFPLPSVTESAKKKAKREKRTVGLRKSIYLGKVFSAWTDAKRTTEASSDRLDEIG